ncbi:unnamed protein product [Clonostachys rosea]|uniref:Uncharacterized protein n=1 Tax=Bionectria ochroleuca TaxID=29856 RepID=A0ABY6TPG7_BIOOC|nr:unnamed protein product [Clonostachys rosea]
MEAFVKSGTPEKAKDTKTHSEKIHLVGEPEYQYEPSIKNANTRPAAGKERNSLLVVICHIRIIRVGKEVTLGCPITTPRELKPMRLLYPRNRIQQIVRNIDSYNFTCHWKLFQAVISFLFSL